MMATSNVLFQCKLELENGTQLDEVLRPWCVVRDGAVWEEMFCLMDSNIGHVNTGEKREDELVVISHGE
jgi:hypothetical protein